MGRRPRHASSTAIAGGDVPDVSLIGTTWMGEFATLGGLDPTPESIDPAQFFEGAWNTTVVDGVSYGVPWYVETRLVYYRTDLAEEGGFNQAPANWDELTQLAQAMVDGGAEYGISLQPGGIGAWQTFMPFFWQAGGEIVDADNNFTLDSEACVEAMTFYDSFFEDGLAQPTVSDVPVEASSPTAPSASFISGPWMIGLVTDAGADPETWTVAHQPTETAGTSFVGGSNLAVFEQSDNKDAGLGVRRVLVSRPEVQVMWYETVSDLPAVQAAWDDPALAEDELLAAFGEQLEDAKAPPAIPTWEQVASAIDGQIEQVDRWRRLARGRLRGDAGGGRVDRHRALIGDESRTGPARSERGSPERPLGSARRDCRDQQAAAAAERPWRQWLIGWSFALPFVLLFVRVHGRADPRLVRHQLHGHAGHRHPHPVRRQLRRPRQLLRRLPDPTFRKAARNTAVYVLFAVPLTIGLGLLAALGLNQGVVRLRNVFRTGYFLPYVTSIVAIAVVWRLILGTDSGLINGLLEKVGIDGPGWLTDPSWSLWSMIMMTDVARARPPDDHLPRRSAGDPQRAVRGGGGRRGDALAQVPLRHAADAAPDAAVLDGRRQHRPDAGLRGALRDDPGRAARLDADGRLPRLQPVQLRQLRLHGGDRLRLFLVIAGLTVLQFRFLRPNT